MDDRRQSKSTSGLPRPSSKLPAQSSKLPQPGSAAAPAKAVRPSASREVLTGGAGGTGGVLQTPKLRSTPSRGQLATSSATVTTRAAPPSATPRSVSSPHSRAPSSQISQTSRRLSKVGGQATSSSAAGASSTFSRSLSKRPSQQWITAPVLEQQETTYPRALPPGSDDGGASESASTGTSEHVPGHNRALRTSTSNSRLSLAERTVQTLSQLPSSPAIKGKAAASFYDTGSARKTLSFGSRPGSRGSRPGSSHQSDISSHEPSRTNSRPGSSSGPGDNGYASNFRSSVSGFRVPMSPISDTAPKGKMLPPGIAKRPTAKNTQGNPMRASMSQMQPPSLSRAQQPRSPSPAKSKRDASSLQTSKPLASRSVKSRPSLNGLFKKPSVPSLNTSAAAGPSRKESSASQRSSATSIEEAHPSSASIASTNTSLTVESAEGASMLSTHRKSSAALREQIAKARAARRDASLQASASNPDIEPATPSLLLPTDNTTFDFGLAGDPFNQRRDDQSQAKILQGRLEAARKSGRLDIAAMGLKEIPADVMNMYNLESIGETGGNWAESVDLTRFVAANNELEMIDDSIFPDLDAQDFASDEDSQGNIFGGLETLDLHGNMLIALPMGLRRLIQLTSLNLSQNRLANNCLEVISQITSLRDVKLGDNLLYGPLDPCFASLVNLEILDLHKNHISSLPSNFGNLSRLRILNVSENEFETLPFEIFASLPLTEITARKNQLAGVLIQGEVEIIPNLQSLDVTSNQLTHLTAPADGKLIEMPALTQLYLSMNRLQALPDIGLWKELLTLSADENNISDIPEGFTGLEKLRSVDFSSNDIRVIPAEVGHMENLATLRLSGNPLRDKKFCSLGTDELKSVLAQRLEPSAMPETGAKNDGGSVLHAIGGIPIEEVSTAPVPAAGATSSRTANHGDQDDSRSDDDFATPPTSAPQSPARSRSHTLTAQMYPVKAGGVLDRSNTQSSSLHPVVCSKIADINTVREVQLHHNLFTSFPESLSFFAETLSALSLAHNQLVGESYLGGPSGNDSLDLPALTELNLSSNHITGLTPLAKHLHAPNLQKLDVSLNRIAALPLGTQLLDAFPRLNVLLISNNHLVDLEPDSIRGLCIVDASNNDIAHLNPRLGLLGGSGGLERLEVGGNRFRVPRWNVLDRGTEAVLRWLRGRVPVAEMAAWKYAEGVGGQGEDHLD